MPVFIPKTGCKKSHTLVLNILRFLLQVDCMSMEEFMVVWWSVYLDRNLYLLGYVYQCYRYIYIYI